jgi:hypothetical protein
MIPVRVWRSKIRRYKMRTLTSKTSTQHQAHHDEPSHTGINRSVAYLWAFYSCRLLLAGFSRCGGWLQSWTIRPKRGRLPSTWPGPKRQKLRFGQCVIVAMDGSDDGSMDRHRWPTLRAVHGETVYVPDLGRTHSQLNLAWLWGRFLYGAGTDFVGTHAKDQSPKWSKDSKNSWEKTCSRPRETQRGSFIVKWWSPYWTATRWRTGPTSCCWPS